MWPKISLERQAEIQSNILEGRLPRYLYKYRPLAQPGSGGKVLNEFTKQILTKSCLWHSSPSAFNDPFDCHISASFDNTRAEIQEFSKELWPEKSRQERKSFVRRMMERPDLRETLFRKSLELTVNGVGVCSYGTDGNNILMWSHYGDSHSGVCFKFDTLSNPTAFNDLYKVSYKDTYPEFNYLRQQDEVTEILLSTKSTLWSYENEWRVFHRDGPGNYSYAKNSLTEVIFGCTANKQLMNELKDIIRADSDLQHTRFRQTQVSKTKFALDYIDHATW